MSLPTKITNAAVGLLIGCLATTASAQFGPIDYHHDLQWFAPVDLDFGNEPMGRCDGYFAGYNKTYWVITGEREAVGNPNIQREMHPVWYDRPPNDPINVYINLLGLPGGIPGPVPIFSQDDTSVPDAHRPLNPDSGPPGDRDPIQRPFFTNSIQSSSPKAIFAWGDRYDMGYIDDERGWLLSIIDGPKQSQFEVYGTNGGAHSAFGGLASPLGDVYVAFAYEPGLMHGFLDLVVDTPVDPSGRVLPDDTDGDGVLDGDGFADDIDADGQFGPDLFATGGLGTQPDTGLPGVVVVPDYDDLVELPTSFQTVSVSNVSYTHGVELMRMHVLSNRHLQAKNQNNYLEIYYGARFFRFRDEFVFGANGGTLGLTNINMEITNQLIGPQLAMRWQHVRGRWSTNVQGRFMFGYNVSDWLQDGFIGEDLIPGANNHPLYLRPRSFSYGRQKDVFAPLGELRVEASYRFSKSVAFTLGWTGIAVDNIYRSAPAINWSLPDMGMVDTGGQTVFTNGVSAGIEINH